MDTLLLAARLVLAVVFGAAALAKLTDRPGTQQALGTFGGPPTLAGPLSVFLTLGELCVAAALLLAHTAWGGAVGALGRLLLFSAGIGLNLTRGRRPDCHCFGQVHSAPIGWRTLARNAGLAAVAGIIVWQGRMDPGPSLVGWVGHLPPVERLGLARGGLLLGWLAAVTWLLVQMLAQQDRLLLRLDTIEAHLSGRTIPTTSRNGTAPPPGIELGLPVGSTAPAFSLPDVDGRTWTLDDLRTSGKPLLLIFADPGCGFCQQMLPALKAWEVNPPEAAPRLLVVSTARLRRAGRWR
jgi:Methylamine utilisation protein MauE/AhpC/TSA family